MSRTEAPSAIRFEAMPLFIADAVILRLPDRASRELPSRGQVTVAATINGHGFRTVVEPDGNRGHWIKVDAGLQRKAGIKPEDPTRVELSPTKEWPEPVVPGDLSTALAAAPTEIQQMWEDITPMARWEWVRWVNATRNTDTRRRRVEVTISKMKSGKRRPCCFDLSACTDPDLSRSGKLIDPQKHARESRGRESR